MSHAPEPAGRPAGGKVEALDSVRGLAALVVVAAHLIAGFHPTVYFDAKAVVTPWLRVWYHGDFAVALFFVLSGFVLSLSFFRTRSVEVLRAAAARRYWRLVVPVAASIALAYGLHSAGLFANREAALAMAPYEVEWLGGFYSYEPSALDAATEALWGAFVGWDRKATYNVVLWTMGYEFFGSLLLFGFLALAGGLRRRVLVYAAAGVVLQQMGHLWLVQFLAGAAICDAYTSAGVARGVARPALSLASALLLAAGLGLGGLTPAWYADATGRPPLSPPSVALAQLLGVVLVLVGVLGSPLTQRVLSLGPLRFVGRISFPLYLVHLPVMCSLGCAVYLRCVRAEGMAHADAFAWAAAATVGASVPLAWVGSRTVEPLSIWLGRKVYRAAFAPTPAFAPRPPA